MRGFSPVGTLAGLKFESIIWRFLSMQILKFWAVDYFKTAPRNMMEMARLVVSLLDLLLAFLFKIYGKKFAYKLYKP